MALGFDFIAGGLSTSGILGVGTVASLIGKLREPSFYSVWDPFGNLQRLSTFLRWSISFLEQFRFVTHCLAL